jgi:hypothetical protein
VPGFCYLKSARRRPADVFFANISLNFAASNRARAAAEAYTQHKETHLFTTQIYTLYKITFILNIKY